MHQTHVAQPSLQGPRRFALVILTLLGLFSASRGLEADPGPDRLMAAGAVTLAAAAVVLRRIAQAPSIKDPSAEIFGRAALGASVGLGLLGAWAAWRHGAGQTGLLFVLAGVLFAIRPLRRPSAS